MKTYTFKARIEAGEGGGASVAFPYNVQQEFGTVANVPVRATIDGIPYRGSLMNCGPGPHTLGVLKAIRAKIGKGPGDVVEVVVWKDDEARTVEIPAAFNALMKKEGVLPVFKNLSYTHRKEYVRWINDAKKEDTRQARLEKSIQMLRSGTKTPG